MKSTAFFVAGSSGGHIIPALTIAHTWKQENPDGIIVFIATNSQLDANIINNTSITAVNYFIPCILDKIPYKQPWKLPRSIMQFAKACIQSYRLLRTYKPISITTTGGHIALPVALAAMITKTPLKVYELNVQPGATVKALAKIINTIYIIFPDTAKLLSKNNCILTKYPLGPEHQQPILSTQALYKQYGLSSNKKTILVCGGSQGSHYINQLMLKLYTEHPNFANSVQFIHQTGPDASTDWQAWYNQHNISAYVIPFSNKMHELYCMADSIICRAGAGSLWQAMHYKKSCITIPLEIKGNNHQLFNAQAMQQQFPDKVIMLRQHELANSTEPMYKALCSIIHLS